MIRTSAWLVLACLITACMNARDADDADQTAAPADTAVAAAAPAPALAPVTTDSLVVAMSSAGPVLQLPATLRTALDTYDREFQPWRLQEYDERVVAKQQQLGALFGVVADYNGDGRVDVALDGHNASDEMVFVILSDGAAYRGVELMRSGRDPEARPRQQYLELYPAGPDRNPGVDIISEGQGGIAYYWKDGRFQEVVTGD
jgi:hypothetical protein